MQRVVIVGSGGAGKTTFARELARRTGLPVIHLDEHFWKPGWQPTPSDEWRSVQEELVAADRWIADGSYGGTFDTRLTRADTVFVFAISRARCGSVRCAGRRDTAGARFRRATVQSTSTVSSYGGYGATRGQQTTARRDVGCARSPRCRGHLSHDTGSREFLRKAR